MAARALASLTVAFGMVSIPVKLYSATQAQAGISFNLLHKGCGSRLKQQYLCASEGVVVERARHGQGLRVRQGPVRHVHARGAEGARGEGHADDRHHRVRAGRDIDPIYYDKAYFLGPDKGGAKPYALLAESMRQTGQTARRALRGARQAVHRAAACRAAAAS